MSYLQYCWVQGCYGVQRGRLLSELNEQVVADVGPGHTLAGRVGSVSLSVQ